MFHIEYTKGLQMTWKMQLVRIVVDLLQNLTRLNLLLLQLIILTNKETIMCEYNSNQIINIKIYVVSVAIKLCFVLDIVVFYRLLHSVMNSFEIIHNLISLNAQMTNTGMGARSNTSDGFCPHTISKMLN